MPRPAPPEAEPTTTGGEIPLEVLVGQLFVVQPDPELPYRQALADHQNHQFGGFFLRRHNLETLEQVREMTRRMRVHWRKLPPAIVAVDEEGGLVSDTGHLTPTAPAPAALGKIDDEELTRDVYESLGKKLRAMGCNTVFAPLLDVNSEPRNPVIGTRAFGDNARLVTRHGKQAVKGLRAAGIAACVKHFPGHGATTTDSHETLPRVEGDRALLTERDLAPFTEVLETAPPDLVMTAHVVFPGLGDKERPATLSRAVLRDLLRGEMRYKGVVITDSMEMKGISALMSPEKAAVEAILAGCDLLLYAYDRDMAAKAYLGVMEAVKGGVIPLDRLKESIERVVKLRQTIAGWSWIGDDDAWNTLEHGEDQVLFESAMEAIEVEGNTDALDAVAKAESPKLFVMPREAGARPLAVAMVREQLEPAGWTVIDVSPVPTAEEIGAASHAAATAKAVVVATASRAGMPKSMGKLVEAITPRDVPKVGIALLDPADMEGLMATNCRILTYGCAEPQIWAACQRILG
jgi:beta-N-acetylhexosaminidase